MGKTITNNTEADIDLGGGFVAPAGGSVVAPLAIAKLPAVRTMTNAGFLTVTDDEPKKAAKKAKAEPAKFTEHDPAPEGETGE